MIINNKLESVITKEWYKLLIANIIRYSLFDEKVTVLIL